MIELKDIVKKEKIIKVDPDDTLSSALAKLRTSHDAAFVFNKENKYLGVINPYYCIIKSSYPGNAKVEHCLYHTPKIRNDFSIIKVAQLFIESKVHYLPVFDEKDNFLGIICARRLLYEFQNSPLLKIKIFELLKKKNKPIFTIYEDDSIAHAVKLFKDKKVSKLIITNKNMKLKGILAYFDLISYLVAPKDKQRRGEREGNHINFYNMRVNNFAKTYVLTLKSSDYLSTALKLILDKKIGSVVISDESRHPIGIITTKDLLNFLIKQGNGERLENITKSLSQQSRQIFGGFFNKVNNLTPFNLLRNR